jgi:dihydrofolate synthase/folylpolyglutamate synthase
VDWAVVEVGLGGRFDATNVLEPRLCLITNIGLDHTDRLGETLEEIAFEKAGILRAGVPAITGAAPPALGVIEAQAGELGAPLWRLGQEIRVSDIHVDATGGGFHLELPGEALPGLTVGMRGRHQIENAALAAAAAVRLRDVGARVPEAAIRAGLASAVIPGRLEVIGARPTVLLDAAHNPDGARALAAALEELFGDRRRLLLVLAVSRLHDPAEVVGILAPLADHVFATASSHPAATPAAETAELARAAVRGAGKALVTEVPTVAAAVAAARAEAEPEDLICVAGSIYALGEVPRSFTTSSSK